MNNKMESVNWWNYVRDEELKPALKILSKYDHIKILDVGGGNGYQAKKISDLGYSIKSIDISSHEKMYFNVEKIDVTQLPFPDKSFNVILTSLVLQHIENLDLGFKEMNRVLSDDGILIHLVPTSYWSLFTNFWHYYQIPKFLIKSISKKNPIKEITDNDDISAEENQQKKKSKILKLFLNPLDQNFSFIHDAYYFSSFSWKKLLKKNSFQIIKIEKCPILSSGYGIFKNRFQNVRRKFSKIFPTTLCIVLKKSDLINN
jgi:ubiquinone/menaquinone biosynthesis C-methylase UbiE